MSNTPPSPPAALSCPIPINDYPIVTMAHGGGGRLTHNLIETMFLPLFADGDDSPPPHDSAVFQPPAGAKLAFTTDSHVVRPLFFPGGDIGSLAVHGTVNDLAMSGARPLYMSIGFILEEGLEMETLWRVACSMRDAARRVGVRIATGDTKVVERGRADGLYINTSAIGVVESPEEISPRRVRPGDAILLSGDLGRHGIAVMTAREGLEFQSDIESDLAPLDGAVLHLLDRGVPLHCLRDLTRGGLSSALNEIALAVDLSIEIDEASVPVRADVRAACELLGLDPLHVANEGRFVAFVDPVDAERALGVLRETPEGRHARLIGRVATERRPAPVTLRSTLGVERVLDMLSGEQLPRIC